MVKAVIFDLDGLLIDSERISYRIYRELLRPFGFDFSLEEYTEYYSGKTGVRNMELLIETYCLPWSTQEGLDKSLEMEREFLSEGVNLKPGARELLQYLKKKNYKTAMASSSIEDRALKILNQHGIAPYFDQFVFGPEVKNGKPAPDIFLKASEKMGENPEDCLVLEDSVAGIQASYAAHIPVICIPDLKEPDAKYAQMALGILDSLHEVISHLEKEERKM